MFVAIVIALAVILFGMLYGFLELGRRLGASGDSPTSSRGAAAVETAIFALMGLLIAFTFSAAQGRVDVRRRLLIDEANAIGTAYLRLDLLPVAARPELRDDFRAYVDSRIAYYRKFNNSRAADLERERTISLSRQIWRRSVAAIRTAEDQKAPLLAVPAINEMIDLEAARVASRHIHAPMPIFVLLIVIAAACALFAGIGMGRREVRSRFYRITFSVILTITVLVIVDMEFPRVGLIRIDALDRLLVQVRADMN